MRLFRYYRLFFIKIAEEPKSSCQTQRRLRNLKALLTLEYTGQLFLDAHLSLGDWLRVRLGAR
jgi:hypothetical protein